MTSKIDSSSISDATSDSVKDDASRAVATIREEEDSSGSVSIDDELKLESKLEKETLDEEAESGAENSLYEAAKKEVQDFP